MRLLTAAIAATLLVAACGYCQEEAAAQEQESQLSYGVSVGVWTHYVTSGAVVNNEPVLQAEGWVAYGPVSLTVWNNIDLTDDNFSAFSLTETNWTLEYGFSPAEQVECAFGYVYYTFPRWHVDDTQEVYGNAAFDVMLSPSVEVVWDIDEVGGTYTNAGIGHGFDLPWSVKGEGLVLECSAAVGYGDSNYIEGCFEDVGDGFVDLVLGVEMPIVLGEGLTLTPSIAWMQIIDSDLRECTDKSEALYGGMTLSADL